MNRLFRRTTSGFSLIELLLVIAVIGIIIALSLFSFQNAKKSSRDAKRKSDLETIRSALELYKSDTGSYPGSIDNGDWGWDDVLDTTKPIYQALVPTYVSVMPVDPRNTGANPACDGSYVNFGYFYRASGSYQYQLVAGMEAQTTTNCPLWCGSSPAPPRCYYAINP